MNKAYLLDGDVVVDVEIVDQKKNGWLTLRLPSGEIKKTQRVYFDKQRAAEFAVYNAAGRMHWRYLLNQPHPFEQALANLKSTIAQYEAIANTKPATG